MKRGYRFAVAWIADNDNSGNGDDLEAITGYVTVLLVADIFGKTEEKVAVDVFKYRNKKGD